MVYRLIGYGAGVPLRSKNDIPVIEKSNSYKCGTLHSERESDCRHQSVVAVLDPGRWGIVVAVEQADAEVQSASEWHAKPAVPFHAVPADIGETRQDLSFRCQHPSENGSFEFIS